MTYRMLIREIEATLWKSKYVARPERTARKPSKRRNIFEFWKVERLGRVLFQVRQAEV